MFLKPSLNNSAVWQGALSCCEGEDEVCNSLKCHSNIHMNAGPKVSQQNIVQSITLSPPACLLPIVHPAPISSQDAHSPGHPPDVKENVIHQTRLNVLLLQCPVLTLIVDAFGDGQSEGLIRSKLQCIYHGQHYVFQQFELQ